MALTLLSFFALAIAGFGVCQASTRLLELPTNALIKLGLGFSWPWRQLAALSARTGCRYPG